VHQLIGKHRRNSNLAPPSLPPSLPSIALLASIVIPHEDSFNNLHWWRAAPVRGRGV